VPFFKVTTAGVVRSTCIMQLLHVWLQTAITSTDGAL
jgi:hypothetical protein